VTLKLKFSDFKQITRSLTLKDPTDSDGVIFQTACDLLDQVTLSQKVRLIGVGVSNFAKGMRQESLLPDPAKERMGKLDKALDAIRGKHGKAALKRGRLFNI